jgi:hypothetical protein
MQQTYFTVHGVGASGSMVTVDGLVTNGIMGDGAVMAYHNEAMVQEMVYQTAGGTAETITGGVNMNLVPKDGGNPIANTFYVPAGTGLSTPAAFSKCLSGELSCEQGISDEKMDNPVARFTWQISPRNKFAAYMDRALRLRGHAMGSLTDPATASVVWHTPTFSTGSAKWTSTVSSKLLLETGFSYNRERYDNVYQDGLNQERLTPAWYAGARKRDNSWGPYLRWNTANADLYQVIRWTSA